MRREIQLEIARALQAHVKNRTTDVAPEVYRNPIASYSDPERMRLEHERVFRRLPIFMGMSCRMPEPGDYIAEEVAGVPVLLVRAADGSLGAFANICRHRGAPVATGCGHARSFSCPYHGWTYGIDGALKGIPDARSFEGVDKASHGLRRLPAAERHGMMFVRLTDGNGAEVDVDAHLSGLSDDFDAYGFAKYSFFASEVIHSAINWKFGVDTFLESYHLPALHRATVAPYILGNICTCDPFGDHSRLTMVRPGAEVWNGKPEAEWDVLMNIVPIYRLFPNSIIVFQSDHLETWRILPGEQPDRSSIEFALYTPEPATTDKARGYWQKNYDLAIATVKHEDFALGEKMQRGFQSGLQAEVIYGRNEPGLIQFHETLKRRLAV